MAVAILLVGGFGTRLMPLTKNTPKPMLTVAGIPVTEHQIAMAKSAGINEIVLATSYLSEVFTPYFGDGSQWGIKIKYAVEKEPLGTGGAIRNAAQLLDSDQSVVVLNGDVLSSHNLAEQILLFKRELSPNLRPLIISKDIPEPAAVQDHLDRPVALLVAADGANTRGTSTADAFADDTTVNTLATFANINSLKKC